MIRHLLKYMCAKICHNRWSSDKAIAKIKRAVFWPHMVVCCHSDVTFTNVELHSKGSKVVKITCSTVVLQCYRRQVIPMEQGKIRPWTDHYQSWCDWLCRRPLIVCQFWLNLVEWGIPRKYVKYNVSVTFCSVPFFGHMPGAKAMNGFARTMAENLWNQARMCLLGVSSKIHPHPQYPLNSENFALRKQFFAQNMYKSWRKCCQNLYSNRKQPMGISNLGLGLKSLTGSSFMAVSAHAQ